MPRVLRSKAKESELSIMEESPSKRLRISEPTSDALVQGSNIPIAKDVVESNDAQSKVCNVPIDSVEISDEFDLTNSDFEEDSEEKDKSAEKVNEQGNEQAIDQVKFVSIANLANLENFEVDQKFGFNRLITLSITKRFVERVQKKVLNIVFGEVE